MALTTIETSRPTASDTTSPVRSAYAMLAVLSLVNLCNFTDRVLFSVMMQPMKLDLALSDTQIGLLGGVAFALLYGFAGLFMGHLADTRHRVKVLSGAMALWSGASAACGYAAGFAQMCLARAVVGVGVSASAPCGNSLIADMFPPERRSLALSAFAGVGTLGTIVGLTVGGLVAGSFGWRAAFVIFALPGLVAAPLVFLFGKEPKRGRFDTVRGERQDWMRSVAILLKRRTARNLLIGMPLLMTIVGAANWIPAFLQRAYHSSAAEVGAYAGASLGIGLVLGTFAGGFVVNVLRRRNRLWEFWWPVLASVIAVPLLALFYLSRDATMAYIVLFFAFLTAGSTLGPSLACVMVTAESSLRGTMVAITVLISSLVGYGLVPSLVGMMSDMMIARGFGEANGDSLRYALLAALIFPVIGTFFFMRAAATAESEAVD